MANETTFRTSQLDFENIKQSLKTYLQQQSEFQDYDFEASGLSNLLDVLAYNTHLNGLFANFSLNEAYLPSAQLRSSVVSIAQTIGYNIRSRTASRAYVNLSLNLSGAATQPASITLPAGTRFTASVDGVSYTFQTRESYTATNNAGIYDFVTDDGSTEIPIYEGTQRLKNFIVQTEDERQIFVIPDETIDTSLVIVKVYDTYTSSSFTSYTNIIDATSINSNSTFYRIQESPNGFYELGFGDGFTTGLKPTVGNRVEVDYLATAGPDANGAASFSPVSQVTVNGVNYDLGVDLVSTSHGGAVRQSIDSIKLNAPLAFSSQQRLVTSEDYKTSILSRYSSVSDAVAWGGEDNDPPKYGVVFVGLLFDDDVTEESKTEVKNSITNDLNESLAVLSIDVEFVDPVVTYLNIECEFSFNPNLTGITQNTVQGQVFGAIRSYVEDNLKTFSGSFRKSSLLAEIDDLSDAVLSSSMNVTMQQRLTPVTEATASENSAATTYTLNFPAKIATPDDVNHRITSSSFNYNGRVGTIKNKLNTTKLQIVDVNGSVIIDNIGSYNAENGSITLTGFAPGVISSGDTFIKINATPESDAAIRPLRNYYLDLDESESYANATVDRQRTRVRL